MVEQSPQQQFVDPAAKTLFAADRDHGNALIVFGFQLRVGVDIDLARDKSVAHEDLFRLIAEVAPKACVESRFEHGIWQSNPAEAREMAPSRQGAQRQAVRDLPRLSILPRCGFRGGLIWTGGGDYSPQGGAGAAGNFKVLTISAKPALVMGRSPCYFQNNRNLSRKKGFGASPAISGRSCAVGEERSGEKISLRVRTSCPSQRTQ